MVKKTLCTTSMTEIMYSSESLLLPPKDSVCLNFRSEIRSQIVTFAATSMPRT